MAAWPAVALVGSYELLMTVIRSSQTVPDGACTPLASACVLSDDADADDLFAPHSSAYVLRYWDAPWSERVRAVRFITACRQMAQEGTGPRLAVDRVFDGAVHRLVQLEPVESGLPERIAGLLL